jgi:hypothetical protein
VLDKLFSFFVLKNEKEMKTKKKMKPDKGLKLTTPEMSNKQVMNLVRMFTIISSLCGDHYQ